ncbi:unnamed protein product [Phaedon cochleariae]|uniref:RNA helicase n=1 Tax=Phaedon cochleariae TaxID=80249 RepID=A0A9N9X7K9_PHACE|nr:unnamed protein product [Phaedon cochleariae]
MDILENFIVDLLKKGIITNYVAKEKDVRNFYMDEYRSQTGRSFDDFFMELWYFWYVNHLTRKTVYFDQRWVNYLKNLDGSKEVPHEEKKFVETNYVTKSKCLLCNLNFTNENSYENHLKCQNHQVRIQYVKDKNQFTFSEEISLDIVEINNVNNNGTTSRLEIQTKTRVNVTLSITNNSTTVASIKDIIKINPMITEFNLLENVQRGVLLIPDTSLIFELEGYFENSASFIFPLVIRVEYPESGHTELILKEIPIEAVSEFSDLKAVEIFTFQKSTKIPAIPKEEMVIPGKRPDLYPSYYKETLNLMPFKISQGFENVLRNLIKKYPSFTERGLNVSQKFFNGEYSAYLQIYPGINPSNYYDTLRKLLDIEENQMKLDIREFDTVSKLKALKGNSLFELMVPGLAEARPSLLVYDSIFLKLNKNDKEKYQGIVHKVLEQSVHLGFNHRFSSKFIPNMEYHIEFGFNRRPIRVEKQALYLANDHKIIPFFYPEKPIEERQRTLKSLNFFNKQLNDEQQSAVRNILACKSEPYIIFGPPGTGKTVTVVESILQIWKNEPSARMMVCAPSNAAANEVASRLVDTISHSDIFRLLGSVYGNMNDSVMAKLKPIVNVQPDGTFYFPSMEELLKRRVLVTTIVTAARIVNGGVPQDHFSYVFIDESGYATETQTLIPIAGILSSKQATGRIAGQVILAGDPRQLGPLVHSRFVRHCGYGTSMLERLLDTCKIYSREEDQPYNDRYVTKLVKNYRSHKTILHVPNKHFYRNELIAAGDHYTELFVGWEHLKNQMFPMMFHHVEGQDTREKTSPSFFNVQEIEEVVGYLSKLLQSRVKGIQINQDHIGVITPYRKQAEKLRAACSKKGWGKILVGSVEQFQGKEKLVVIVSTVRSKNCHKFEEIDRVCQLGFLKNPKRFNVALTRARALLVIVGNANVLKTDKYWSSFIQYCAENSAVAGRAPSNIGDNEE